MPTLLDLTDHSEKRRRTIPQGTSLEDWFLEDLGNDIKIIFIYGPETVNNSFLIPIPANHLRFGKASLDFSFLCRFKVEHLSQQKPL